MEHVRGVASRDLQDKAIPQEGSKDLRKCKALSPIQGRNPLGDPLGKGRQGCQGGIGFLLLSILEHNAYLIQ